MRIRSTIREYDLDEAATILNMPIDFLRRGVKKGWLKCFYKIGQEYLFHDASLAENLLRFGKKGRTVRPNLFAHYPLLC